MVFTGIDNIRAAQNGLSQNGDPEISDIAAAWESVVAA